MVRNTIAHYDFKSYFRAHAFESCLQESDILGVGEIPREIVKFIFGTCQQFENYLSTLTEIKLYRYFMDHSDEAAMALANALKVNLTVTHIDLKWNQISDEGAMALADAPKVNSTVTYINLGDNQISDEATDLLKATYAIFL